MTLTFCQRRDLNNIQENLSVANLDLGSESQIGET